MRSATRCRSPGELDHPSLLCRWRFRRQGRRQRCRALLRAGKRAGRAGQAVDRLHRRADRRQSASRRGDQDQNRGQAKWPDDRRAYRIYFRQRRLRCLPPAGLSGRRSRRAWPLSRGQLFDRRKICLHQQNAGGVHARAGPCARHLCVREPPGRRRRAWTWIPANFAG